MAYEDGTRGLSSQAVSKGPDSPPVEDWLRHHYDGGLLLMDDYRRPIGPVESGVPMARFIGVGNKPYWRESLDNPGKHATWIVLQQGDTDALWQGFTGQSRAILADHFVEVYRSGAIHVYKRRPPPADFVEKRGQHLYQAGRRWNHVGVNSYDLLEQSRQVIDDRLDRLAAGGHNTVRTWCFDKDGGIGEATLDKLAVTLHHARTRGLRVICTLANHYPDFGGPGHFTPPGADFFISATARARYREQVRRMLEYRDSDGLRLADTATIAAWDLVNEPRNNPGAPPTSVTAWVEEMANFVSSIDQRHLVTVGGEGFGPGYPADPVLAGPPGADFSALCRIPAITLCTGHLFPKYLGNPRDTRAVGRLMQRWRSEADALDKPVFVEEVGYALVDHGDPAGRQAFYAAVAQAVAANDLDGALLWNLGARPDRAFTLAYGEPSADRVLGTWSSTIPATPS
jgi:mannan endo-1,4-beta-mannosidase